MPPLMPASTKLMPFAFISSWRRFESLKFELPPSTIVSPGSSSAANSFIVCFGRVAGGHHQPDDAWRAEHAHDVLRREAALEALAHDLARLVGRPIEGDDPMTSLVQPAGHVAPHAAEADDRELHVRILLGLAGVVSLQRGSGSASACVERGAELGQARVGIVRQVDARDRQIVRFERDEIARGLRVDQRAERLVPARDLEIVRVVRRSAAGSSRSARRPCAAARSSAGSAGRSRRSRHGRSGRAAACAISRSAWARSSVGAMYAWSAK